VLLFFFLGITFFLEGSGKNATGFIETRASLGEDQTPKGGI
jgi:hypothetical protein